MCVCQCRYRHHTSAFPYSIMIMYDIFIIITVIGWKRRRFEFASLPVFFMASHMIRYSLLKCHQIYHIHGMKKRSCIANMLYRYTVAILVLQFPPSFCVTALLIRGYPRDKISGFNCKSWFYLSCTQMIINGSIRCFKSFERTEHQFIEKSTAFFRFDIFMRLNCVEQAEFAIIPLIDVHLLSQFKHDSSR